MIGDAARRAPSRGRARAYLLCFVAGGGASPASSAALGALADALRDAGHALRGGGFAVQPVLVDLDADEGAAAAFEYFGVDAGAALAPPARAAGAAAREAWAPPVVLADLDRPAHGVGELRVYVMGDAAPGAGAASPMT